MRQVAIAAVMLAVPTSAAFAMATPGSEPEIRPKSDISPVLVRGGSTAANHTANNEHLPPVQKNFDLVSKLELKGRFGDVSPEQIADVAVHKGFAYLNSWNEPTCQRGGTYIVDIRDPANPKEIGFVAAPPRSIHGEGADVITYNGRDILAVNNEACTFAASGTGGPGGFDLIDVTDPFNPVKLGSPGAPTGGDTGPDNGSLSGTQVPHSNHSTVMWESQGKLYLITVDNVEVHDVDIHDISDPANPVGVAEYYLCCGGAGLPTPLFPQIQDRGNIGSFVGTFHHDTKVKIVNGRVIVNTAYWDGGYVTYDLTDPLVPRYIGDTSFDGPDPLTRLDPPEGNAHYAEFSHDNRFILAADEDFTTHRAGSFDVAGTPFAASGVGGGLPAATLPDRVMNGPTVYGGYACDASLAARPVPLRTAYNFILEPNEEAILVVQRGPTGDTNNPEEACFPGEKAKNAWDAGWRNVLFINRHPGTDGAFCGSGDFRAGKIPVSVCTTHEAGHFIFNSPPQSGVPYNDEAEMAPVGTVGRKVRATSQFDGWGYAHLYRNMGGKQQRIDSWAVAESLDERFSSGFGDLSIHEHAVDPTENVSYVAYYSAGARAITFGDEGITETGAFVDKPDPRTGSTGGNNFWGVEQFNGPGNRERLIAFSDRDYGLYILRYTGPGAPVAPSCQAANASTRSGQPVTIRLTCTDPNTGNVLTRSLASQPAHGTVVIQGDDAVYTPAAGYVGADRFTFRASDGSLVSEAAAVTVAVASAALGAPRDVTDPRISLISNRRQSLRSLRSGGLRFRMRFDEAVRIDVTLLGRLSSKGARGKARKLATATRTVAANRTVTITLRPSAAMRKRLQRERRLPGLIRVKAVDAAGNDATRTKPLLFR